MTDLEFIKEFSKISISKVCEKENVKRPNVLAGRTSKENIKKVRRRIEDSVAKLYIIKEDNVNGKDNKI